MMRAVVLAVALLASPAWAQSVGTQEWTVTVDPPLEPTFTREELAATWSQFESAQALYRTLARLQRLPETEPLGSAWTAFAAEFTRRYVELLTAWERAVPARDTGTIITTEFHLRDLRHRLSFFILTGLQRL